MSSAIGPTSVHNLGEGALNTGENTGVEDFRGVFRGWRVETGGGTKFGEISRCRITGA